jgi:hypothetical protein
MAAANPFPIVKLKDYYPSGGKIYVVRYKPTLSRDQINSEFPILMNSEIKVLPPSPILVDKNEVVFTWVIGKNTRGEYVLYCRRSLDTLELFSKHISIVFEVQCDTASPKYKENCITEVIYAGEIIISYPPPGSNEYTPHVGTFNVLSGTFMSEKTLTQEDIQFLSGLITELSGITMMYSDIHEPTLITSTPTMKQLYDTKLVNIYAFDNAEEANTFLHFDIECKKMYARFEMNKRSAERFGGDIPKLQRELDEFIHKFDHIQPITMGGKSRKKRSKRSRSRKFNGRKSR